MLSEINDDIIRNKEDHVTHIKALRQHTVFQKGDLENFKNENIELKKDILDLRAQIKLLKVELGKARALSQASHPLNRQICAVTKHLELVENATKVYQNFQSPHHLTTTGDSQNTMLNLQNDYYPGTFSRKKQQSVASGSTRASSSNPFDEPEYLKQQIDELKLKLASQEEEFKVKMGRMTSFYDATLKKLNQKQVKKPNQGLNSEAQAKLKKEYHLQPPSTVPIKKLLSHQDLPKVQAHQNVDKKQAEINRYKIRDYRVMSANLKTAGIAKKNKVRISEDPKDFIAEEDQSGTDSLDLVQFNGIDESLRDAQIPLMEANESLK